MTIAKKHAQQYMPNGEVSLEQVIQAAIDEATAGHDAFKRAFAMVSADQLDRIRQLEAERVPEGYVLVQKNIHPLDCDNGDRVVQLLANTPDAGRFDNPQDYYQYWWEKLCLAAAPAQEKENSNG